MLTEEQANELNLAQHSQELAEFLQSDAQKKVDNYLATIKSVADNYNKLSPESKAKMKEIIPKLQEWYRNAVNERAAAEDRYWRAQAVINNYKEIDAATPTVTVSKSSRWRSQNINPSYVNTISKWIDSAPVVNQQITPLVGTTNTPPKLYWTNNWNLDNLYTSVWLYYPSSYNWSRWTLTSTPTSTAISWNNSTLRKLYWTNNLTPNNISGWLYYPSWYRGGTSTLI